MVFIPSSCVRQTVAAYHEECGGRFGRHSGSPRSDESGIHNPCAGVMDSGLAPSARLGMTIVPSGLVNAACARLNAEASDGIEETA
jgi:hypothetical protein